MWRPAGVARNHAPGRRPATPPFRHYERNVRMHQCETGGHRSCATPKGLAKAGPEPTIAAVERREASVLRYWTQGASHAPAGVRHSPADGCRCTRAPVGAPLPSLVMRGNMQTSEDKCLARRMMRARKS